jgi:hypothetical protein
MVQLALINAVNCVFICQWQQTCRCCLIGSAAFRFHQGCHLKKPNLAILVKSSLGPRSIVLSPKQED